MEDGLLVHQSEHTEWPLAIFIMGPTATGKTRLAMSCADEFDCELISVDSAQVYQAMDLGTAKPDAPTLVQYPHHLIDFLDPAQSYSAGQFRADALSKMNDITTRGKIPVLVGGTMLYFNALQYGIAELPEADPEIRARLDADAKESGWQVMHSRLAEIDPASAERIHPNDPQRIQRALEVYEISGKTLSQYRLEQGKTELPYRLVKIAIMPKDRTELRQSITLRFDQMLVNGLLEEVRRLYQRGDLSPDLPAIRAVGYRQVWAYLEGQIDYEEMRDKAIIATAQLAKRQMTWLRSEKNCNFLDPASLDYPKLLKNLRFLLS